ncbi:helix-turn-helix domain-containing protein [Stakelama tenebrarum]|uniref:Helix-turn-helix domain-containing protein n=1 Tax=Stakelama tenebrarum TaxID=2711215 RepID=A0A6G6Y5B4_9SPHN|nr:helix-turn-helix domain-containing protein [Sphingosinithalassobacter tenebrarum]QIG80089.1 helix-turn-helix domain-containing protein [Sphingosinithalassobacter tenebrarum]
MTGPEIRAARDAFGLSAEGLARLLEVQSGRTVRKWESGDRKISGPASVLLRALLESQSVRQYFGVVIEADSTAKSK